MQTGSDELRHWVNVRDKPAFLHAMALALAGNARLSLEGDLSRSRFSEALIASREETSILKRNTLVPEQDFIVLTLAPENVKAILEQIDPASLSAAILHVQIERDGELQLGAYDNFHPECVMTGSAIAPSLLDALKSKHTIRNYERVTKGDMP